MSKMQTELIVDINEKDDFQQPWLLACLQLFSESAM